MRQLLLCLAASAALLLAGCSEETINKEVPVRDGSVIELVTFSFADNPTKENKGFGPGYYCYINLDNDSVYIQRRVDDSGVYQTIAKASHLTDISSHPAIVAYIDASKQYKSGKLITPKTPEGVLYCGLTFYTNYRNTGKDRIHYFTSRKLDERFELFTDYVLALLDNKELKPVHKFMPGDSVMVPIVNHKSFGSATPWSDLPPPPPIRSKVNYTPPLEK
jgi:hypothetical protein